MNKVILNQLDMLKNYKYIIDDDTTISDFNDIKDNIVFLKSTAVDNLNVDLKDFVVGKSYIVELASYIINEPKDFDLSIKWNNGIKPVSKILKITVNNIKGKMCNISGCGYDLMKNSELSDTYSYLWLPLKSMKLLNIV